MPPEETSEERLAIAARWVVGLHMRGVTLSMHGKRLRIVPGRAFKQMSDEEHRVFRNYRAEIKSVVENGLPDVPVLADAPSLPPPRVDDPLPSFSRGSLRPVVDIEGTGIRFVNGKHTHALGDEYAQRVLRGEIPRAEAIANEGRAARQRGEFFSREQNNLTSVRNRYVV